MLQVPVIVDLDPRFGEWFLIITQFEVGGGHKTTHCISCFAFLLRSLISMCLKKATNCACSAG